MKYLLSVLCLFIISCDSGGDGTKNLSTADLNGEWWAISFCQSYSACDGYSASEDCEDAEDGFYIYANDGTWYDCHIDDDPECSLEGQDVFTIGSGNSIEMCELDPDEDEPCSNGTVSLDGDILQLRFGYSYGQCTFEATYTLERKD